ncbi:hypothetical protein [Rhizobium sp. FY34]|uniref:hypothetical protein n=1 Tax=Rhizobium sp. FY34 TaxID=2562309 RepID=UPI0010BFEC41|nr:hypothetical protein [Rhizobium sp. FY34]
MRMLSVLLAALIGSASYTMAVSAKADEQLVIENKTKGMIVRFYAQPANGKGQKVELFKKRGLGSGKSRTVSIPVVGDNCLVQIRAEFEEADETQGYESFSEKLNVCEIGTYTIE